MALGAVPQSYDCHRMPGWDEGAVGYHIDDGKIFEKGCRKRGREVKGMGYCDDRCTISATRISWRSGTWSMPCRPFDGDLATIGFCFSRIPRNDYSDVQEINEECIVVVCPT